MAVVRLAALVVHIPPHVGGAESTYTDLEPKNPIEHLKLRFKLERSIAEGSYRCGFGMIFDIISFLAGVAAGAITGVLAAILHGLENTADLQERLRRVTKEVESMDSMVRGPKGHNMDDYAVKQKVQEMRKDLEEIHEEIRRMYKKTTR